MKIFGWPADSAACGYYRLKLPLEQLAERGHETLVQERMPWEWFETADIIIAQRTCQEKPTHALRRLRKRGRAKLIMELDDDLLHTDPSIGRTTHEFFSDSRVRAMLIENISEADMVTVSTEPLAEVVAPYNANVVMLPNCVDERIFGLPAVPREGAPFTLGWEGSATHGVDWGVARGGVARFMRQRQDVAMWFLGHRHDEGLPPDRVGFSRWTTDFITHYRRVGQFDVGLSPLWRSPFNRAKSHLRALTYCAVGVPGIYSAEAPYRDFIEHGQTGMLARGEHDWFRCLRELRNDDALRLAMGRQARQHARAWTIQAKINLWEDAYRRLLGMPDPSVAQPVQPVQATPTATGV